jgi:5-methylthioadenosine/S-adenosylhomocysteine deaminase
MSRRRLLRGGCVLTLGVKSPNLAEGDVLIEAGRIAEVGRGLRARDAEVVDAADTIVMPGFVDTHRHAWKTLLRHLGGGRGGEPPAAALGRHYQPDDVYAATLLALLSAVESGITTVVDWADIQVDARYTEAALQAHADAGLRTVLVHAAPAWTDAGAAESGLRQTVARHARAGEGRTTIAFGPAAADPPNLERVRAQWALARELGLRTHAHAGLDQRARGAVAEHAARGLLGADVTLVHGTHLGGEDLDAIAAQGTAVALTPASELAGGLGPPPLQALIDRGIRPGLGVDDELAAPGELFAQMRALQSLQHATVFDRKLAGKAGLPHLLSTREVIRYATVDGARVAGLGAVTGALEPGKQADVILLRTDRPNIAPVNDPIGAVVWGMDPSNLDSVFVDGRPLLQGGILAADVARVRTLAQEARQRVAAAAGHLVETGSGGPR